MRNVSSRIKSTVSRVFELRMVPSQKCRARRERQGNRVNKISGAKNVHRFRIFWLYVASCGVAIFFATTLPRSRRKSSHKCSVNWTGCSRKIFFFAQLPQKKADFREETHTALSNASSTQAKRLTSIFRAFFNISAEKIVYPTRPTPRKEISKTKIFTVLIVRLTKVTIEHVISSRIEACTWN